jgi:DNA-binding GntR family transcriptional regulator
MRALVLKRQPLLAAQVADQLREAITYGTLRLGEAISEERIATLLGVSRTPVREALTALQMQGLVVIQPQRGSFVFQPDVEDIAELCEFRAIIEGQAMRLAHARHRVETREALKKAEAEQDLAEKAGRSIDAARADAAFHNAFIAGCGNPLLEQAYLLVSGRIGAVRFFARNSRHSRVKSNSDHRDIIRAFGRGDLRKAEQVLTDHIMRMRPHFADALKETTEAP